MLFLVRHGEASHHIHDLTGGWTNSELTSKGKTDIKAVAKSLWKKLEGKTPKIIASDLQRAQQSAKIIADEFAVEVLSCSFLREKNNGLAANKTNKEAAKMKLVAIEKPLDTKNYPEGESKREFFQRVKEGMDSLILDSEPLIIVSHKGTIQNILFWWLNLSIDDVHRLAISFDVDASSISILHVNKWQEHAIKLLNDCSHLK